MKKKMYLKKLFKKRVRQNSFFVTGLLFVLIVAIITVVFVGGGSKQLSVMAAAIPASDRAAFTPFEEGLVRPGGIVLHGSITDEDNETLLLLGAVVNLFDKQGHIVHTTKTNANGYYKFSNVSHAAYKVVIQREGYANVEVWSLPLGKYFKNIDVEMHRTLEKRMMFVTLDSVSDGQTHHSHSWGNYHWARTANQFTLKLVDSLTSNWDSYLVGTSVDWTVSSVLDTTIIQGLDSQNVRKRCAAVSGQNRVCNALYGTNGWLGVATIWVSGNHIVQGTTKVNDSYFNTVTYNTPARRQLVMCQEVGHNLGLNHQDINFDNPNLGTCMDYTNDPDGTRKTQLSNQHPNTHDYDQLSTIYLHLDSVTTVK